MPDRTIDTQLEITVRPFEERDYPAVTAMFNAVFDGYPSSEEEQRHDDARYDGTKLISADLSLKRPAATSSAPENSTTRGTCMTRTSFTWASSSIPGTGGGESADACTTPLSRASLQTQFRARGTPAV